MARTERIGRYEIVTHLASGGFGQVYLARVGGLGGFQRHVVLKTLEVTTDEDQAVAMFLDEARVLGLLHHQHVAPIYEVAKDDGRFYIVMDYLHGRTSHEVWQRTIDIGAELPLDFSLTVVAAAAAGLHYAHTRRGPDGQPLEIVHRDVSLSNLLVGFDGAIKLIDFGIAKAANRAATTQVGFVKGKVGYMAPEQIRGQAVDPRTDVFALGIVLYELTTMRRCFREDSDRATLEKIKQGTYEPPTIVVPEYPRDLERIVGRALRVDPRERYPDADTMRRELEALGHRLHMVLGDAAIVEVMGQLFDDRHEPWRRTSRAETELAVPLEVVPQAGDDDLTRPNIAAAPRGASKLRAATELIQMLDTPPRGTVGAAPKSVKDTDGVPVVPPLKARSLDSLAAVPSPLSFGNDTSGVTNIRDPLDPGPPTPAPDRPGAVLAAALRSAGTARPGVVPPAKSRTKKVKRQHGPMRPYGWIVAGVVGAAAIAGAVFDLIEDDTARANGKGSAIATVGSGPPAIDAGFAPTLADALVSIDAGVAAVGDAAPVDAATKVTFKITSTPPDATITLDGQKLGKTPYEGSVDPAPGTHVLRIRRRGYATIKLEVQLVPGEIMQDLTLKKARDKDDDKDDKSEGSGQLPI